MRKVLGGLTVAGFLAAAPLFADPLPNSGLRPHPGFSPRVPVSPLAAPAWFDPSRLHLSTSVTVGSGFGRNVSALQVTSLSYEFGAPLALSVSLGNAWGSGVARSSQSFFLEGVDLAYRPLSSLQVQVHFQDLRSPLQLSPAGGFGFYRR